MATATGGLLRLPRFLRAVLSTVKAARVGKDAEAPNLLNPEVRAEDLVIGLGIAVGVFTLRIVLHWFVFPRLFARYPVKLRSKLSENLFYSCYYTAAFAYFALAVLPNVEWSVDLLSNESNVVRSLVHPVPPPMAQEEHFYYSQCAGFYLSATTFLTLFDGRRSDFSELILHHLVTVGLIAMSFAYGYVRAGIVIIALHDIGDVFLYGAKFLHHLGFKGIDTAVFAVFAITFYVTRLLMFSRIVHAIFVETLQTLVEEQSFNGWAKHFDIYLWHYLFFVVLLGTLLFLHCFWFALVLKMIYREVVLGKKISDEGDIRSDDEDADEDDLDDAADKFLENDLKKET